MNCEKRNKIKGSAEQPATTILSSTAPGKSDANGIRVEKIRPLLRLYAITDRRWLNDRSLSWQVEQLLIAGVTMLQIREKGLDFDSFLAESIEIHNLCLRYNVPLIINDNLEIAMASHAEGVHLGQDDLPISEARRRIGHDKIIGISARTVELALEAERNGADYIGTGAVFSTATKDDAQSVTKETLREITQAVSIPVVAIGGIKLENVAELAETGIAGVAVVSALFDSDDPQRAAREFLKIIP